MSDIEEIEERLARSLPKSKYKRLKDSRLFEVVEEVFDYPTLMALYELINRKIIGVMHGVVAAGKEARIYWAETPEGEDIAVKIFLVSAAEFRRGRLKYIEGDPRFKRVGRKIRDIVRVWCSKEFRNLRRAFEIGVRVPRPLAFRDNVLVMEFIDAGERGVPAPLIKDYPPEDPEEAFKTVCHYIELLYTKGELVHADLSEYNIMNTGSELVIIDWGSAVHAGHPSAEEFLLRDISTIFKFFEKLGVSVDDPLTFFRHLVARKHGYSK